MLFRLTYLSEGSKHLVWAIDYAEIDTIGEPLCIYTEPISHKFVENLDGMALKLDKYMLKRLIHDLNCSKGKQDDDEATTRAERVVKRAAAYSNRVVRPLMGEKRVPVLTVVWASLGNILQWMKVAHVLRPAARVHGEHLQVHQTSMCRKIPLVLMPDLTRFAGAKHTLCIEIKPKWGFMPTGDNVCRFCMQQHLKLREKEIERLSCYCPLDLYSHNKERIEKALSALRDNPQNNIKIFYRHGHHVQQVRFEDTDILLSSLKSNKSNNGNMLIRALQEQLSHRSSPLQYCMQRLRNAQRELDMEGITELVRRCCDGDPFKFVDFANSLDEQHDLYDDRILSIAQSIDDYIPVDTMWCSAIQHHRISSLAEAISDGKVNEIAPPVCRIDAKQLSCQELAALFLLSATLKDCSIMIVLDTDTASESLRNHYYNVYLLDTDEKPCTKLPEYLHQEHLIRKEYGRVLNEMF